MQNHAKDFTWPLDKLSEIRCSTAGTPIRLIGSERQIKWAETLRRTLTMSWCLPGSRVETMLNAIPESTWWISNRFVQRLEDVKWPAAWHPGAEGPRAAYPEPSFEPEEPEEEPMPGEPDDAGDDAQQTFCMNEAGAEPSARIPNPRDTATFLKFIDTASKNPKLAKLALLALACLAVEEPARPGMRERFKAELQEQEDERASVISALRKLTGI